MGEKNITAFKYACKECLSSASLAELRSYGREEVGVARATTKKKEVLIEEIIAILCGELAPIPKSKKGAPVLDHRDNSKLIAKIESLRLQYLVGSASTSELNYENAPKFDFEAERKKILENPNMLRFEDPDLDMLENADSYEVRRGQLETLGDTPMLLPLNCIAKSERIVIPVELIQRHKLREGDTISCYVRQSGSIQVAMHILTINDVMAESFHRGAVFEECAACYPSQRFTLYKKDMKEAFLAGKYLEWLAPIGKGQRCCVRSAPKMGKTRLLSDLARCIRSLNENVCLLVLLVDQSPESVAQFRRLVNNDNLVYSTYEDDAERQVFTADYVLKRAKRLAESGRDVALIVDSFDGLAKAYNETKESMGGKTLPCGVESKTLHYIRKYFGAARALEKKGSLTIIGAVSCGTGNPGDEIIASEISALANLEINLSDELAIRRVYPALDFDKIFNHQSEYLQSENEIKLDLFLKKRDKRAFNAEKILQTVDSVEDYETFSHVLKNGLK